MTEYDFPTRKVRSILFRGPRGRWLQFRLWVWNKWFRRKMRKLVGQEGLDRYDKMVRNIEGDLLFGTGNHVDGKPIERGYPIYPMGDDNWSGIPIVTSDKLPDDKIMFVDQKTIDDYNKLMDRED